MAGYDRRTAASAPWPEKASEAIIYVAGIEEQKPLPFFAEHLSAALSIRSSTTRDFKCHESEERLVYGDGTRFESPKNTISGRVGSDTIVPIVDIYVLSYLSSLTRSSSEGHIILQILELTVTIGASIVIGAPAVMWVFSCISKKKPGKTLVDIIQVGVWVGFIAILVIYLGFLIFSFVLTFTKSDLMWPQNIVVISTTIAFFVPKKWMETLLRASKDYTAVMQYLLFGAQSRDVESQLLLMIGELQSSGNYKHIHIVGYSFGSLLAIDTLYPSKVETPPAEFTQIKNFVTFGCPYDMVRTFYPTYYSKRRLAPYEWTNIYIPGDVFGSNFREDNIQGDSTMAVDTDLKALEAQTGQGDVEQAQTEQVTPPVFKAGRPHNMVHLLSAGHSGQGGWLECLSSWFLCGLAAHGQYWCEGPTGTDISGDIVCTIFKCHWALEAHQEAASLNDDDDNNDEVDA
jgi:hypothetical protein